MLGLQPFSVVSREHKPVKQVLRRCWRVLRRNRKVSTGNCAWWIYTGQHDGRENWKTILLQMCRKFKNAVPCEGFQISNIWLRKVIPVYSTLSIANNNLKLTLGCLSFVNHLAFWHQPMTIARLWFRLQCFVVGARTCEFQSLGLRQKQQCLWGQETTPWPWLKWKGWRWWRLCYSTSCRSCNHIREPCFKSENNNFTAWKSPFEMFEGPTLICWDSTRHRLNCTNCINYVG